MFPIFESLIGRTRNESSNLILVKTKPQITKRNPLFIFLKSHLEQRLKRLHMSAKQNGKTHSPDRSRTSNPKRVDWILHRRIALRVDAREIYLVKGTGRTQKGGRVWRCNGCIFHRRGCTQIRTAGDRRVQRQRVTKPQVHRNR